MRLRIAMFYHSLVSDWNHGNAHFLRGIASELVARSHELRIFEPEDSWSRKNLVREHGPETEAAFARAFPRLSSVRYDSSDLTIEDWLDGVDLVLVHEWNDPSLIKAIGEYRRKNGAIRVFFHDTHHRAVTRPDELARFHLDHYDGVLAYGHSLKAAYEKRGWGKQVWVWHEAADTRIFHPIFVDRKIGDLVWIGNWGDEERTQELRDYLIGPVKAYNFKAKVYGVRYPDSGVRELNAAGISYGGWLPNFEVPAVFAHFRATAHVPRRPYVHTLPGIPTIRPFEALACGIPLVSAPWEDTEGLFQAGRDLLMAHNRDDMQRKLYDVLADASLREALSSNGLETIRRQHTCAHRVDELLSIYQAVTSSSGQKYVPSALEAAS